MEDASFSHPAQSDHDLLVRIDERTKNWDKTLETFVTKKDFAPVKAIVYGMVGAILLSVLGAIVGLVLKR